MRATLKAISLILFSILYYVACTVLIAWQYGKPPLTNLVWTSWGAAIEMAVPTAGLGFLWWIVPLFFGYHRSLAATGFRVGVGTLASLAGYTFLILCLDQRAPNAMIGGSAARIIFVEDVWVLYGVLVIPTAAIISGLICCAMLALVGFKKA
jgi:hypothetical protein